MKDQAKQYFLTEQRQTPKKEGKLSEYTVSVKDCICVKDMESTASSPILKGYKPEFNATVVEKVKEEGATIIGKTKQDEFGFGTFCLNTGKGIEPPRNPEDSDRVTGGSSGGAAGTANVLDNHIALAESTGGSIANPAAFCNVVGLTPTYGLVSRYGLIDYANSLDKIGVITNTVSEAALGLDIIKGKDPNDTTSIKSKTKLTNYDEVDTSFTIGIPKHYIDNLNPEIKQAFTEKIQRSNINYETITLPLNKEYSVATYYIIAMAEASTNLARYAGMRYGQTEKLEGDFNEYFSKVRTKHFSDEAKRRILIGTYARMAGYRDAYYEKALKVRTKLINEYKQIFEEYDAIAYPTMPIYPPKVEDVEDMDPLEIYQMDLHTIGPNLAGLPHISIPMETQLPSGLMITTNHFEEKKLLKLGETFEQ